MFRTLSIALLTLVIAAAFSPSGFSVPAEAKSYRAHAHGFRTGTCKTSTCRAKHPGGRYVHPLTRRRH